MSLGAVERVHRARRDAATVALLLHDAEITELEPAAVADEHVQRREIAMEQLPAMQLAEHLEDAGNLAARGRLPASRGSARCRNALRSPCGAYSSARQ